MYLEEKVRSSAKKPESARGTILDPLCHDLQRVNHPFIHTDTQRSNWPFPSARVDITCY